VHYAISVPASEQSYLTLTQAAGTLQAGQRQVIMVTVAPAPNGPVPAVFNTVTVDAGAVTVRIYFPPSG
jgi:hypothetical protein